MANGADIAKAYVQIIPSADGIKGQLTELMGGEAEKAGKSSGGKFGKAFGSAVKTIGKVGAAAIGAAATGLAALTKTAVGAYAEYEQLVGGVETLFGASSDAVMAYAENAYKTAGLSANEYMSTVTSFSASLLQSLGGDTAAAAKVGDMAVSDMSDNANKMGTSMEAIQTAYQGFAKQNYTMLDNLKLGYGGTKSEMERLLEDATALSGVEYDIDSLSDVYEAIHVIQGELGITGTTAKEASTTISGSFGMMSAAWQNLLTGFGDSNADMEKLFGDLVSSAETVLGNLLPVTEQAIGGIADAVGRLAPVISERLPGITQTILPPLLSSAATLVNGLLDALVQSLPTLIPVATDAIMTISNALIENLPAIMSAAMQILVSLATGIADNLPTLIPTIVDVVLQIVDTLTQPDTLSALIDASIAIIIALANGLIDALPKLLEKAPEIVGNLVDAVVQNAPKLLTAAWELIKTLASGIVQNLGTILQKGREIVEKVISGVGNAISGLWSAGMDIVRGIWQGISNGFSWITGQIRSWVGNLVSFFKKILKIGSPSKVFADEVGKWMALGMGEGFVDEMGTVEDMMGDSIPTAFDLLGKPGFSATSRGANAYNYGGVTIQILGREKDADQLAVELQNALVRRAAAWA